MKQANTKLGDPQAVLEYAAELLNQQLWCWGRDIEFKEDNLLLRRGFQRTRLGEDTSSIYRLELSSESRVVLRGFCVFFGQGGSGGLFLRRFEFSPKFSVDADISESNWRTDDFSAFKPPTQDQLSPCHSLLLGVVDWIRRYETWIAETLGTDYRKRTLRKWNAIVPADEMVAAWRKLSLTISESPGLFLVNPNNDQ